MRTESTGCVRRRPHCPVDVEIRMATRSQPTPVAKPWPPGSLACARGSARASRWIHGDEPHAGSTSGSPHRGGVRPPYSEPASESQTPRSGSVPSETHCPLQQRSPPSLQLDPSTKHLCAWTSLKLAPATNRASVDSASRQSLRRLYAPFFVGAQDSEGDLPIIRSSSVDAGWGHQAEPARGRPEEGCPRASSLRPARRGRRVS